ncbi:MAG: 2-hydroxychromene-2-carboxylate isomerase [Rubrivivax sp.]
MPTTEFHFDFGSPNAYLAHQMMPALQQRTGQTVDYVPVLLGGLFKLAHNRSPVEAYAEIPNKLAYERLEMRRFIQRHGLTAFRFNPHFPVNTLKVMRGAVAARRLGCFAPYVDAVYAAMWEHGRNLSDDAEIASVLQAAGLDPAAIAALSQDAEVKAELLANTERSHARGAFGSPTFFVGDEIFFGKDKLRDVEDEMMRTRS